MASLDQIAVQIRFGLEQLSAKNSHHEFEHLCRHFARQRICSNLLPATGPVSAGGDQGRDFETFRSYLRKTPISETAFIGRLSDGPVAFACTIQKDTTKNPLKTKIKNDITTILKSGSAVVGIHYFCTHDLATAKRHAIQEWCLKVMKVELDILDGQALSESLADRDVFWIAARFLSVPSEIYPRDTVIQDDNYEDVVGKWKEQPVDDKSYSQFDELKQLVRYATREESVKQDLPFWIKKVSQFTMPNSPRDLRRLAQYEATVATLRGLGSLIGYESKVVDYFDNFEPITSIAQSEDCVNLLSFCLTAQVMGHAEFDLGNLECWHGDLVAYVERELEDRTFPSTVAHLLQLRGMLSMHQVSGDGIAIGINETFEWYAELSDILPDAHLFPVEKFSDTLSGLCPYVGDHPQFSQITEKVDAVLETRVGGFAVASKCRDRAMAFHDSGHILKAIAEIHKAKINWFAAETILECVLALLVLARWYTELGLVLAGKYYALAAAFIAIREDEISTKARAWEAIAEASHCDYTLGAFAGFVDLIHVAQSVHLRFAEQPICLEDEPTLQAIILHSSCAVYFSEKFSPQGAQLIRQGVDDLRIGEAYECCLTAMREVYGEKTDEELFSLFADQFSGVPVSDIGLKRTVSWNALDIDWSVHWTNVFEVTVLAEQFIACLQTIQVELVNEELCLPKASVNVFFELASVERPEVHPTLDVEGFCWRLLWPSQSIGNDADAAFIPTFAASIMLICNVSYKKQEGIIELMENLFQAGVPAKTMIAQSYEMVYLDLVNKETFNAARKVVAVNGDGKSNSIKVRPQAELSQASGPGPGYTSESAAKAIRSRYKRTAELLPVTIQNLKQDEAFRETLKVLRAKGWKDWHILSAALTTALNYRFYETFGPRGTPDQLRHHIQEFTSTPELPGGTPVPAAVFSEQALEFHRKGNLGSILQSWGFTINHPAYTPEVIEDFLSLRYGYWEDDVEHKDIFGV